MGVHTEIQDLEFPHQLMGSKHSPEDFAGHLWLLSFDG